MKINFSFYKPSDFGRVYQFLRNNSENDYLPYERVRFQFCLGLHSEAEEGFRHTCGIWEDNGGIVSLVLTEGGQQWGESFFIFRSDKDKTWELLTSMCSFAEHFTSKVSDDRKRNFYRIPIAENDKKLLSVVTERNYIKTAEKERKMIKKYGKTPEKVVLPENFKIEDARTIPAFYTALAHKHSFRYNKANHEGLKGFEKIRTMPDYKPALEIMVLDQYSQPAGLANFWVNEKSSVAYLEPLGVVWWHQNKGIGRALINEGINRTQKLGCTQLVGGDMAFYHALGFKPEREYTFWQWSQEFK